MPIYNKLVRDKIPEIIKMDGKLFTTKTLNNDEFLKELKTKSLEELNEYLVTNNDKDAIEELADLLEIIHSLAKCHGASFETIEEVRKQKAEKRGAFKKRIFLIEVQDD